MLDSRTLRVDRGPFDVPLHLRGELSSLSTEASKISGSVGRVFASEEQFADALDALTLVAERALKARRMIMSELAEIRKAREATDAD